MSLVTILVANLMYTHTQNCEKWRIIFHPVSIKSTFIADFIQLKIFGETVQNWPITITFLLTPLPLSDLWLIKFQPVGRWCNWDSFHFADFPVFVNSLSRLVVSNAVTDGGLIEVLNQSTGGLCWEWISHPLRNKLPETWRPRACQSENCQIWNGLVDKFTTSGLSILGEKDPKKKTWSCGGDQWTNVDYNWSICSLRVVWWEASSDCGKWPSWSTSVSPCSLLSLWWWYGWDITDERHQVIADCGDSNRSPWCALSPSQSRLGSLRRLLTLPYEDNVDDSTDRSSWCPGVCSLWNNCVVTRFPQLNCSVSLSGPHGLWMLSPSLVVDAGFPLN